MAKMTFKLPEETIRKMEALGSHYDAVTSAVLEEGVKPLYDAAKQSLSSVIGQGTKEPSESTGDLLESLSVTKPYQSADGNWNIKVGCIGYDRKGVPNPLKAAVLEHATGLMAAFVQKKVSSEVGFKGICKKVAIFCLVGIGHVLDTQVIQNGSVLRTAVIFFYLSNEEISIIENVALIGLPAPKKLKEVLEQLHEEADEKKEDE